MSLMKRLSEPHAPSQDAKRASAEHAVPQPRGTSSKQQAETDAIITLVQDRLINQLKISLKRSDPAEIRRSIDEILSCTLHEEGIVLSRRAREEVFELVVSEVIGFGPLEPLLADGSTTDIMVIGPEQVYVERKGKLLRTNVRFRDCDHLKRIIERIMIPLGRRVDESSPTADARLPDGSRVNVVLPPVALDGPALTIRKFSVVPLTVDDLISFNTATDDVFEFLQGCVKAGLNIIVAGGSSSGKTTLLNVLSGYIPQNERIVTIENAAELQLRQPHVVRLESRPSNVEEQGEVTVRDLVINSLRMRPDRIVVGEVRSGEALDLLQAMNTGHDGSMGTLHANSARDALSRLETMVLSAGMDLPVRAIREQMASAINLIVYMGRARDGMRRILVVSEVEGMEIDSIHLSDIFRYEHTPGTENGSLVATGLAPKCIERLEDAGVRFNPHLFDAPLWLQPIESSTVKEDRHEYAAGVDRVEGALPEQSPDAYVGDVSQGAPVVPEQSPPYQELASETAYVETSESLDAAAPDELLEGSEPPDDLSPPPHKLTGLLSRLNTSTDDE